MTRSAQGVMVPVDAIWFEEGVPMLEVESGDTSYRIAVNVLAADEDNAVVTPRNAGDALVSGQKVIKP